MNCTNTYVPEFVPSDLKWYKRDGLMTWYDQVKCEQFLEDVNKHFRETKIVNFDMINKLIKGEEISEGVLRDYQAVYKKKVFNYPIHQREKTMSAALRSSIQRDDVFISKELVDDHLKSPLNDNTSYLSSMKKRFNKKKARLLLLRNSFKIWKNLI